MEPTPLIVSVLSRCALGQAQSLGGTAMASQTWPTNNLSVLVPFRLLAAMPVKQVWWLQGSSSNGSVDVGVYNLDGRLLLSGGSVAQSVAGATQFGVVTFGTPTILYPGSYYLALAGSSTTGTFYHLPSLASGITGWKMMGLAQVAANMPLADNITPATYVHGATPRCPYFGICSEVLF